MARTSFKLEIWINNLKRAIHDLNIDKIKGAKKRRLEISSFHQMQNEVGYAPMKMSKQDPPILMSELRLPSTGNPCSTCI
jgi:hypothetical protein